MLYTNVMGQWLFSTVFFGVIPALASLLVLRLFVGRLKVQSALVVYGSSVIVNILSWAVLQVYIPLGTLVAVTLMGFVFVVIAKMSLVSGLVAATVYFLLAVILGFIIIYLVAYSA